MDGFELITGFRRCRCLRRRTVGLLAAFASLVRAAGIPRSTFAW